MTVRGILPALCTAMTVVWGCGADRNASGSDKSPPAASTSVEPTAPPLLAGSFAYVDSTGTEVLALASLRDRSAIRGAVCSNGKPFQVHYERTQQEQKGNTHRQIAQNFRNERGDVFRLLGGAARPSETCFLTTDSLFLRNAGTVQPLSPTDCLQQQAGTLARIGGREVVHCWRIAQVSWGAELLAAQFVTIDTSALAGLALVQDSILLFYGIPATYRGADEDIWRVDDQGVFSPETFGFLFAARLPTGYGLALTWAGAEGESDKLLVADSTPVAREIVADYRYWAPE